jgi:hypothetical protein
MVEGRFDSALGAARQLDALVRSEAVASLPFLEDYAQLPIVTLARFGRWDAVLVEPAPPASMRFATARWHHARALAHTRRGDVAKAKAERDALAAIAADPAWAAGAPRPATPSGASATPGRVPTPRSAARASESPIGSHIEASCSAAI